MLVFTVLIFLPLIALTLCQSEHQQCGTKATGPSLTVQFTPAMPVQTPPTSTIFRVIMTSYLNVIDCKYVAVENVDDNPAQTGQFFYKTTADALTVYRVGCMPETTAITRRELRGYDWVENMPLTVDTSANQGLTKRTEASKSMADQIFNVASQLAQGIDPVNDNVTVEAYRYLIQINTALFALNLINSGLPLNRTCEELRDAETRSRLQEASINPRQAGDIVCFANQYGVFFNRTNQDLLSDLAALEYAVQVQSGFTEDVRRLCETMDLSVAFFLGIDAQGLWDFVCHGTNVTNTWTSTTSPTGTSTPTGFNDTTLSNMTTTTFQPSNTSLNFTHFPNVTTAFSTPVQITVNTSASQIESGNSVPMSFSSAASLVTVGTNGTTDTVIISWTSAAGGLPPFANNTQSATGNRTIIGTPISWPAPVTTTVMISSDNINNSEQKSKTLPNYGVWKTSSVSKVVVKDFWHD